MMRGHLDAPPFSSSLPGHSGGEWLEVVVSRKGNTCLIIYKVVRVTLPPKKAPSLFKGRNLYVHKVEG
jgi:hypothetical protein